VNGVQINAPDLQNGGITNESSRWMQSPSDDKLRMVAKHEKRSPKEIASRLFELAAYDQDAQSWASRCWEQLSPRQKQVAAYVCQSDSSRQIAGHLHIAKAPVKSHIEIILKKFGINSYIALRQLLASRDLSNYL
jgi:DNA-binding CsgD family transcriptional regulator